MVARTSPRLLYGAVGRIGIVAGMHVAALYLIAMSLGIAPPLAPPKTEAFFVPEAATPVERPPPVDPVIERPIIPDLIAPEVLLPDADPVPTDAITGNVVAVDQIPVTQPGSALPVPTINPPAIDPRRPLSRPPYPADVLRLNGEGRAVVEIYVMENGRVGDVRIVKSSGFESLDRATINEAKRNWRLKPATRDGVPVAQWHRLVVAFQLENR